MEQEKIIEAEKMILVMADIVYENRALRKELAKYRMKSVMYDARLCGKNELAEKLIYRFRKIVLLNWLKAVDGYLQMYLGLLKIWI